MTIPIIGQTMAIGEWFITAQLSGACVDDKTHHVLFAGKTGAVAVCPTCRHGYRLKQIKTNPLGKTEFQFELVIATPNHEGAEDGTRIN